MEGSGRQNLWFWRMTWKELKDGMEGSIRLNKKYVRWRNRDGWREKYVFPPLTWKDETKVSYYKTHTDIKTHTQTDTHTKKCTHTQTYKLPDIETIDTQTYKHTVTRLKSNWGNNSAQRSLLCHIFHSFFSYSLHSFLPSFLPSFVSSFHPPLVFLPFSFLSDLKKHILAAHEGVRYGCMNVTQPLFGVRILKNMYN